MRLEELRAGFVEEKKVFSCRKWNVTKPSLINGRSDQSWVHFFGLKKVLKDGKIKVIGAWRSNYCKYERAISYYYSLHLAFAETSNEEVIFMMKMIAKGTSQ